MKTPSAFFLAFLALNVQAAQEPIKATPKPMTPVPVTPVPPVVAPVPAPPRQPQCADPAGDIKLQLLSKAAANKGRVRVTGVVTNAGATAWIATTYTHRLRAVLAVKVNESSPSGTPVATRDLNGLGAGQSVTLDYELDWEAKANAQYPKFMIRFNETGQVDYQKFPLYRPDCRTDNNVKQISAADINALFGPLPPPPAPLKIQSYRLSGGTKTGKIVETMLAYQRDGSGAARLSAAVTAPHAGTADAVSIAGTSGSATVRVRIDCRKQTSGGAGPVRITYTLTQLLSTPLGSTWIPAGSVSHTLA